MSTYTINKTVIKFTSLFYYFAVTNGKHEFVPKNVFADAEKFAKVLTWYHQHLSDKLPTCLTFYWKGLCISMAQWLSILTLEPWNLIWSFIWVIMFCLLLKIPPITCICHHQWSSPEKAFRSERKKKEKLPKLCQHQINHYINKISVI